jgi:outer membrane biosynthesis protein TonB
LPHGLNDRAVAAAKLIRFRPATKKGKPITVSKMVTYSFTRY